MTTTSNFSASKAIEKVTARISNEFAKTYIKKNNTLHHSAKCAINNLLKGQVLHTIKVSGYGQRTKYKSYDQLFTALLDAAGYKHKRDNIAPRGGEYGKVLRISKQAAAWLREVAK